MQEKHCAQSAGIEFNYLSCKASPGGYRRSQSVQIRVGKFPDLVRTVLAFDICSLNKSLACKQTIKLYSRIHNKYV